jgi:pimeloyl-ACP methyl ester carboxylesterase
MREREDEIRERCFADFSQRRDEGLRSISWQRKQNSQRRQTCKIRRPHSGSSPPEGWQDETYRLTSDAYVEAILAVSDALALDRPIVMGCSIGGRVALHLALMHPERFGAAIGLQSGAHVDPYYDLEWLHRPDVHGGEVCAGIVSGLVGAGSPARERWETLWHYMQARRGKSCAGWGTSP